MPITETIRKLETRKLRYKGPFDDIFSNAYSYGPQEDIDLPGDLEGLVIEIDATLDVVVEHRPCDQCHGSGCGDCHPYLPGYDCLSKVIEVKGVELHTFDISCEEES